MFRRGGECVGLFCISKSGHDAGDYYVIVSAAGNFVHVSNGKNRTIQMPKKKNIAHLDITSTRVPELDKILAMEMVAADHKLALLIKNYKKRKESGGV